MEIVLSTTTDLRNYITCMPPNENNVSFFLLLKMFCSAKKMCVACNNTAHNTAHNTTQTIVSTKFNPNFFLKTFNA